MNKRILCLWTGLACSALAGGAAADAGYRADSHAPIAVMGEHMHKKGEWMFSYRYMRMKMQDNRIGTDTVSNASQLRPNGGRYMVVPTRMNMNMHMLGAMYAPSDRVTMMLMLPFIDQDMDHLTARGGTFSTESSGIGDVKLSALVRLFSDQGRSLILNLGVGFPTGSIDETGVTPASAPSETILPYPMQLGSGTFDVIPGVTYAQLADNYSWGAQVLATIRTGSNDRGYTLGDRVHGTVWAAKPFAGRLSGSLRLKYDDWGNYDGRDAALNPRMVPTADPSLRGGKRLDVGVGLNWIIPGDRVSSNRFAVELIYPLRQDLNGPQLETQWSIVAGWQVSL